MDCCDGLMWDDVSKTQDVASALHPFTSLVCKQAKVNEGRACKNLKWGMFAFSFFTSLNAFLDTCASKVTDSSEGKLSQNHSILERKWPTRSVALGRRGVWGKTQEREAGVRLDPQSRSDSRSGNSTCSRGKCEVSLGEGRGGGGRGERKKAWGLWGWGGGLVWAPACCGPEPWGAWCGTQWTRKTFHPAHRLKKWEKRV